MRVHLMEGGAIRQQGGDLQSSNGTMVTLAPVIEYKPMNKQARRTDPVPGSPHLQPPLPAQPEGRVVGHEQPGTTVGHQSRERLGRVALIVTLLLGHHVPKVDPTG